MQRNINKLKCLYIVLKQSKTFQYVKLYAEILISILLYLFVLSQNQTEGKSTVEKFTSLKCCGNSVSLFDFFKPLNIESVKVVE